jgi:arachidonate 15-lipoxygenase
MSKDKSTFLEKSSELIILLVSLYGSDHLLNSLGLRDKYKYNHDYLNPLAITDVPDLKKITLGPISIPTLTDSIPSFLWIAKVAFGVFYTKINELVYSLSTKLPKNILDPIIAEFKEANSEFAKAKDEESLNKALEKLASTLEKLSQVPGLLDTSSPTDNSLESLFKARFQEIESKISLDSAKDGELAKSHIDVNINILKNVGRIVTILAKFQAKAEQAKSANQGSIGSPVTPRTLEDYNKVFQIVPKPDISNQLFQSDPIKEDLIFAYLQVGGANPVVIERFKGNDNRLPINQEQYSAISILFGSPDSFNQALSEGRLYVSDYTLLNGLVNGNYVDEDTNTQKYTFAPVALFAVPPKNSKSRSLFPVAISFPQTTISQKWELFTPLAKHTTREAWLTARSIVLAADATYQALISHLGRSHLVVEPFVVPTYNLPVNHPVRRLLLPHLEGTLFINHGAHTLLVAPKQTVDSLLGSSIGADQAFAAKAAQSYLFNFNQISFPEILANRGVKDTTDLPVYPYRDDGLLIWNAIEKWVQNYLEINYKDDSHVLNDADLQGWASTLASFEQGRLQNFGDKNGNFGDPSDQRIQTRSYLVKVLSTVIFIASAHHAAVNYPQGELMSYTPAYPFARYLPSPTTNKDTRSFVDGLPPLSQAINQINLLYLLGSVYHTKLGYYYYPNSSYPDSPFTQSEQGVLEKFQNELHNITKTITERNAPGNGRLISYKFLLPDNIPQSINI